MTQYTVGVRDLKARLSFYLEKAQKGHVVVVTLRGKPIARLTPVREELSARAQALRAAGIIQWSGKRPTIKKPKLVNKDKKQLSDMIVEMRQ
ncbi:MAG: type II toxin-antitoxin system prevent-host-death family antitoxin [Anaerolineales bacterium]|nr:type II toxin-antitoxin system prevent-host-death family antitoxin [Anaerolineales bacterium]